MKFIQTHLSQKKENTYSWLSKLTDEQKKMLLNGVSLVCFMLLITSLKYLIYANKEESKFNVLEAVLDGMGGMYLMSQLCSSPISELMSALSENLIPAAMLGTVVRGKLEMRRRLYEKKDVLPEGAFQKAMMMYKNYHNYGDGYPEFSEKLLKRFMRLTSLVKRDLCILEDSKIESIKAQVKELVAPYDADTQEGINDFVSSIIMNIVDPGNNPKRIRPLFISGPPGIGKTRFVEKLSEIIGIVCVKKNVTNLDNSDLAGCQDYDASIYKNGVIVDSMIEAAQKSGVRNTVLFLDEIQTAFKSTDDKSSGKKEFFAIGATLTTLFGFSFTALYFFVLEDDINLTAFSQTPIFENQHAHSNSKGAL